MIQKSTPTTFVNDLIEAKYGGATIMVFFLVLAMAIFIEDGITRTAVVALAYLVAVPVGTLIGRVIKR